MLHRNESLPDILRKISVITQHESIIKFVALNDYYNNYYLIILSISALLKKTLQNNLQFPELLMLVLFTRTSPIRFVLIYVFYDSRGHQMCSSGQSSITGYRPYLHVTPHLKLYCNCLDFVTVVEEFRLQYDYVIYKMISHDYSNYQEI